MIDPGNTPIGSTIPALPTLPAISLPTPFSLGPITTDYGAPSAFTGTPHSGVDIGVNTGTAIPAFIGGTVTRIYRDAIGGLQVIVTTPAGFQQVYAHLSSTSVRQGATVSGSDVIGWSGATGHVTGPHLHYEVRTPSGGTMDPRAFLAEFAGPPGATGPTGPSSTTGPSSAGAGDACSGVSAATLAAISGDFGAIGLNVLVTNDAAGAAKFLRDKYPQVPVACLQQILYGQAKAVNPKDWASSVVQIVGDLTNPRTWAKVGLTIVGVALIGLGAMMYVGALKGEAIAAAAGRIRQ